MKIVQGNISSPSFIRQDLRTCIGYPKINARFEFAAIFALSCWQSRKKNSLTAESLGLVKIEHYTIDITTCLCY